MSLPPVRMHSFGCRLNQLETEAVALAFSRAGFPVLELCGEGGADDQPVDPPMEGSPADAPGKPAPGLGDCPPLVFINTCTVTTKAEQKARRLIRAALREDPRAVLIVSGCYAQMEEEAIRGLGERVIVLPGSFKDSLMGLPARLAGAAGAEGHGDYIDIIREELSSLSGAPRDPFAFEAADFRFHSRASLKVEEGCDNACAFCRVHLARGKALSLDPDEVLRRARALEAAGWAEIILTGVNISQYRHGSMGLGGLVSFLIGGTERVAFRLSSYEPDRLDRDFFRAAALPRLRPFFHFPLQSASPAVLARMGRDPGGAETLKRAVETLRELRDDPFISYDLICGFPGETEEEHQATLSFVEETRPTSLHVFSYSPRPGTAAARMKGAVPERVTVTRSAALIARARELRAAYVSRWEGKRMEAVLEGGGEGGKGRRAFTENALRAWIEEDPGLAAGRAVSLLGLKAPEGSEFDLFGSA